MIYGLAVYWGDYHVSDQICKEVDIKYMTDIRHPLKG